MNSLHECSELRKVSKSLGPGYLFLSCYRRAEIWKIRGCNGRLPDTCREDYAMDADSYFLTGKVALAMDSYDEAASNFKQAYGEDSTYDMAIEIYEAYLDKDMEADGTRYLEAAFLLRPRMPRTTVTEAVSTIIWKTTATQKKSFWKQPRRIIRKHCFFWEWYIWPRMMWKMLRQCTSSIFLQWVIPPRAIMVWHCAISEAEIMIPLDNITKGLPTATTDEMQSLLFNEIVAYEKKLDFATALTKVQEYIEMFPEDSAAKKERAFLKTRTSSEG